MKAKKREKVRRITFASGHGYPKVSKGSSPRVALARRGSTCSDVVPMLFLGSATICRLSKRHLPPAIIYHIQIEAAPLAIVRQ